MNTHGNNRDPASSRRGAEWAGAFASGDPARVWAAACSVADAVTGADGWADSTARHEAACGAYDAVLEAHGDDVVPAAILGARRAAYWERQERMRLVPPSSLNGARWRYHVKNADEIAGRLIPLEPVAHAIDDYPTDALEAKPRPRALIAEQLGAELDRSGWQWQDSAADAVDDAIESVLDVGRDRAAAQVAEQHPDLPGPVADSLVLLVAGSRRRVPHGWPGAIWLAAHHGSQGAADDAGMRAVIDAIVDGRRARPAAAAGAMTRHVNPPTPSSWREAIAS